MERTVAQELKLIDVGKVLVHSSEKLNSKPNVTQKQRSENFSSRVFNKEPITRAQVDEEVKRSYHKMNCC